MWIDFAHTWHKGKTLWPTYARQFFLRYDQIWSQGGHFVAFFFVFLNHNSNIPELILFKPGTKAKHCGLHKHINSLCDTIKYGCWIAILLRFFQCPWTVTRRSLNWFCSNLVQKQSTMTYMSTSISFTMRSNMAAKQPLLLRFFPVFDPYLKQPWTSFVFN